nr:PAS domain S-box protein [Methylomarinum sp. Ch1-1]MDP4521625.1 PAS domain S-box protein [Methylomarinum sp. Ch1-1]
MESVAQKRRFFTGFVACAIRIEDILTKVISQVADVELVLTINDDGRLLYSSPTREPENRLSFSNLEQGLPIHLAGHTWQVRYRASRDFYSSQQSWATWWLLLGGLMLTSLTGLGLMLLTGRAARVEELVNIKTRDLECVNQHLNQEMAKRHKLQIEQGSRTRVLEQLAKGDSLNHVLQRIALDVEQQHSDMLCSILLLDSNKRCLYNGASPSLPAFYVKAIDGIVIGEGVGACGTAAYRKQTVIVEDILKHPFWREFNSLLSQTELRACWSEPVISSKNNVLGTFAIYYRQPQAPNAEDLAFIKRMAQLVAIAIEWKNNESEQRIAATTFQSHEAIVVTDREGTILRVNEAFSNITGYSESEAVGQNPRILSSGHHEPSFYRQMFKTLKHEGRWQGEIWNRRKNGEVYPEWMMVTAVKNEDDIVSHYVAIFSDITEKKRRKRKFMTWLFMTR